MRGTGLAWVAMALAVTAPLAARPVGMPLPTIVEASIDELADDMANNRVSSEQITKAYLNRIAAMDRAGPKLRSIIAINPDALAEAKASDARRRRHKLLGPLDGIPVLIKDNIETRELPTTAGSLALRDNMTGRDAPVVARLRAAGAVILGKTNLSEWANIRSGDSMSGWSAIGGLVRNPYALDRSACGSSSGTGAAIAASFAAVGVGTETDGSVVCPSSMNGLVGLKPTLGAVSRTYVVPISSAQDTPGPMGRSVRDVALLYAAMIGSDPADPATRDANAHRADFAAALKPDALKGVRVAVLRPDMPAAMKAQYEAQLAVLKAAGAVLVDVKQPGTDGLGDAELGAMLMELKTELGDYLSGLPSAAVHVRSLADVIAFNKANADTEMAYFDQALFEMAQATGGKADPGYAAMRARATKLASDTIDAMLAEAKASILIQPTYNVTWLSDPVFGDNFHGPSASRLPAIAGYPHLTVPMGLVRGLPAGLSFIGPRWSEGALLGAGYAYEQASKARVAPGYAASVDAGVGLEGVR